MVHVPRDVEVGARYGALLRAAAASAAVSAVRSAPHRSRKLWRGTSAPEMHSFLRGVPAAAIPGLPMSRALHSGGTARDMVAVAWAALQAAGINRPDGKLLPVKSLVSLSTALGIQTAVGDVGDAHVLADAIDECYSQIKDVTAQLVDSRSKERIARHEADRATKRSGGLASVEIPLAQIFLANITSENATVITTFSPLVAVKNTWTGKLQSHLAMLDTVAADVTAYHGGTMLETFAASKNLPGDVAQIKQLVSTLWAQVEGDLSYALSKANVMSGHYLTKGPEFVANIASLSAAEAAQAQQAGMANATIASEVGVQTALTAQRAMMESNCESLRVNSTEVGDLESWEVMEDRVKAAMGDLGNLY